MLYYVPEQFDEAVLDCSRHFFIFQIEDVHNPICETGDVFTPVDLSQFGNPILVEWLLS